MKRDSPILFLTICSFHKKKGGTPEYSKQESIIEHLSAPFGNQLLEKRKEIFSLLKSDRIIFDNSNENDHEYNKSLQPSEDLGFSEAGGLYLPAIERYNGRFYTSLESGKTKIINSPHHFLIISGLYGLLLAEEPTQLYSVPIEWGCNVQSTWMENGCITEIFIDYIQTNQIKRIYDFTARDDYRDLINWDRIKMENGVTVLHAMSTEGAGNNALNSFGEHLGESYLLIQSSEKLLKKIPDKNPHTHKEWIYFTDTPEPWDKFPKERNRFLPGEGILYYSHIPDIEVYDIFKTAEKLTQIIYNHDKNLEDAGSIGFNEYAKGYEVMLDIKVRKPIQKFILTKYPSLVKKKGGLCESRIRKKILDGYSDETISLGEWEHFEQNLKKCPEIGEKILEFIKNNWGDSFKKIISKMSSSNVTLGGLCIERDEWSVKYQFDHIFFG